jgi:hypothetical protein
LHVIDAAAATQQSSRIDEAFSPAWLLAHESDGFAGHVFSKVEQQPSFAETEDIGTQAGDPANFTALELPTFEPTALAPALKPSNSPAAVSLPTVAAPDSGPSLLLLGVAAAALVAVRYRLRGEVAAS